MAGSFRSCGKRKFSRGWLRGCQHLSASRNKQTKSIISRKTRTQGGSKLRIRRLIHFSIMCILAAWSLRRTELYTKFAKMLARWLICSFTQHLLITHHYVPEKQTMKIQGIYSLFRRVWETSSWRKLILPCVMEHYLILSWYLKGVQNIFPRWLWVTKKSGLELWKPERILEVFPESVSQKSDLFLCQTYCPSSPPMILGRDGMDCRRPGLGCLCEVFWKRAGGPGPLTAGTWRAVS